MEYNIVEDMKNIRTNIYLHDLCSIERQRKLMLKALKEQAATKKKSTVNAAIMGNKSKYKTPPFLPSS
jgi:hypothetical protein